MLLGKTEGDASGIKCSDVSKLAACFIRIEIKSKMTDRKQKDVRDRGGVVVVVVVVGGCAASRTAGAVTVAAG